MKKTKKKPGGKPVRLCIDFGSKKDMLSYIQTTNWGADFDEKAVAAFPLDAIDTGRINQGSTYILKYKNSRPEELEVK